MDASGPGSFALTVAVRSDSSLIRPKPKVRMNKIAMTVSILISAVALGHSSDALAQYDCKWVERVTSVSLDLEKGDVLASFAVYGANLRMCNIHNNPATCQTLLNLLTSAHLSGRTIRIWTHTEKCPSPPAWGPSGIYFLSINQ